MENTPAIFCDWNINADGKQAIAPLGENPDVGYVRSINTCAVGNGVQMSNTPGRSDEYIDREFSRAFTDLANLRERVRELEAHSSIRYYKIERDGSPGESIPDVHFETAIRLILDHLGLRLVPETKKEPHLEVTKNSADGA